jgi:hypothetical protein
MRFESESLSFLARPNLNGYIGRSQATAMAQTGQNIPPPYPPGAPQPS